MFLLQYTDYYYYYYHHHHHHSLIAIMQDIYNYLQNMFVGQYNIIIIIVLFDDAEELTTEMHFLCAFNLMSRIRISASFVILHYKQCFIKQADTYGNLAKIRHCVYFRQSHVRHVVSILTDMLQH
jgi:hypothetical protein